MHKNIRCIIPQYNLKSQLIDSDSRIRRRRISGGSIDSDFMRPDKVRSHKIRVSIFPPGGEWCKALLPQVHPTTQRVVGLPEIRLRYTVPTFLIYHIPIGDMINQKCKERRISVWVYQLGFLIILDNIHLVFFVQNNIIYYVNNMI